MTERVNKLYRPAELDAAITKLTEVLSQTGGVPSMASKILIRLHAEGWRLVKTDVRK